MNDPETIAHDASTRLLQYKARTRSYYEGGLVIFPRVWGASFHFALFSGTETRAEALRATEHLIAAEGGFRPGLRVLDVGCGIGGPALTIVEHFGVHVTGVDLMKQHVEIARKRAAERGMSGRTQFVHADAMRMPLLDNSFDGVYVFESGCHMPDKAAFYKECARVLRPGGRFVGIDWLRREGLTSQEETRYIEPICRFHALPSMITLAELRRFLTTAGLDLEVLEDASARWNLMRNWEPLDEQAVQAIRSLASASMLPTLQALTAGGIALAEAARAGAFLVGHWVARKHTVPVAAQP